MYEYCTGVYILYLCACVFLSDVLFCRGIDYFNCYGKFVDEHTVEAVDVNGEKV